MLGISGQHQDVKALIGPAGNSLLWVLLRCLFYTCPFPTIPLSPLISPEPTTTLGAHPPGEGLQVLCEVPHPE